MTRYFFPAEVEVIASSIEEAKQTAEEANCWTNGGSICLRIDEEPIFEDDEDECEE